MAIEWKNFDELSTQKKLLSLKNSVDLKKVLDASRIKEFQADAGGDVIFSYAAKEIDQRVLTVFQELADEANLTEKFRALYEGDIINTGENRKVLHHLTRGQLGNDVVFEGKNLRKFYEEQRIKINEFAEKVHSGAITPEDGKKFSSVVQIGIGGSDLGPRAMYLALENWARVKGTLKMQAKFISNVDPDDGAGVLASCDLAHTLFILVSKSGTTQETLANELFVRNKLEKAGLNPAKHMVAVTSETSPLAKSTDYLASFFIDDFIGGRFSSTSAVG
ncbi:MAG: glucose-6-phosphate isomerase, partial [Spirochaetaceae bacterium]|nr:glucose-6-phosphate isomerase [Spirochaetaceae bacterium]